LGDTERLRKLGITWESESETYGGLL
jgi:hypothetical protein